MAILCFTRPEEAPVAGKAHRTNMVPMVLRDKGNLSAKRVPKLPASQTCEELISLIWKVEDKFSCIQVATPVRWATVMAPPSVSGLCVTHPFFPNPEKKRPKKPSPELRSAPPSARRLRSVVRVRCSGYANNERTTSEHRTNTVRTGPNWRPRA